MIAVIFETYPKHEQYDAYLHIASELTPLLSDIDGFISIERFSSMKDDAKILSLSFWRDKAAVQEWRNLEAHRTAQASGRDHVFDDYRIRIADVSRDYAMKRRDEAPKDSNQFHKETT